MKTYSIFSSTQRELNKQYLLMLNGFLKLTEREMDLLLLIVEKSQALKAEGLKDPYLSEFLLNTSARKEYCEKLGISAFNCTNLLKALKDKEALIRLKDNIFTVPSILEPQEEIRFTFSVKD